jgi:hypothetical protein
MIFFSQVNKTISIQGAGKGVQSVEVTLVATDLEEGEVNITDLMLQGGRISTVWVYHPSEIRWSHDG